jgi:mono/diheme cytochrome c family protein
MLFSPSCLLFRNRVCTALLGVCIVGLWLVLQMPQQAVQAQQPSPEYDPAQVTIPIFPPTAVAGRASFLENCAPCHGETGNADGPTVADLPSPPLAFADSTAIWERSPAQLFHTTKFGRMEKLMPPWSNQLNDSEIWNTVAYAWSLHTSEQEVESGKVLYEEACIQCHGLAGRGDGPEAEGNLGDLADLETVTFQSQASWLAGWQDAHREIGADWSLGEQNAVLEYIRTFSYNPPWISSYRPGPGVISGSVVQRSAGGPQVAESDILLQAYQGFDPVATFTSTLDSAGRFEFRNLATDPTLAYLATVSSDGISYSSDFINLTPITQTAETEIAVFAGSDDPSGVYISRSHWIIDSQPGALLVGQIVIVGNDSDRTFIGQQVEGMDAPATVALSVPPEAIELSFENGELGDRFQRVGNTVYDTLPVSPGDGTRQIIMRYGLPYDGSEMSVQQEFLYPVDQLTLLVADLPDLKVDAPEMQFNSVQQMQDRSYQVWSKESFPPQPIEVSLQGLLETGTVDPRAIGATGETPAGMTTIAAPMPAWVGYLIAGVLAVGLVATVLMARQRGNMRATRSRQEVAMLRESLLDRIAQLDDLHTLGEIDDEQWLKQRSQLKAQLVDVMRQGGKGS